MAIGITGANNGYSRKVADERFIQTAGGTVTGNLTVTGTLSTTLLEALSANITVIDIKQYELSGFNVLGNATVQGSVSATGDLSLSTTSTIRTRIINSSGGANGYISFDNSKLYGNNWGINYVPNKITSGGFGFIGTSIDFTDLFLERDAANTLAQRNGLNAQESRIYSTYTNASNYERFFIKTNVGATSATQIGLSAAGTGQNRSLEFVAGGSTRMTIASTGNVGIGTTTASTKLEITTAVSGDGIKLNRSDGERVAWLVDEGSGSGALYMFNGSNSNSVFITGNGNSFLNGGNVGIGTGSPSAGKLVVDGNIAFNNFGQRLIFDGSATHGYVDTFAAGGARRARIYGYAGVTLASNLVSQGLTMVENGNVGIGTTTPTAKLDILDTTSAVGSGLSGSALNIAQTWNTTGTPTALSVNVTDLSSNAASLLMDLRVGGSTRFSISKNGGLAFGSSTNPVLRASVASDGAGRLLLNSSNIGGATLYGSLGIGGNNDTILVRDVANTLAQRNDLNPQESRIYGTYSSSGANYERFFVKTNTGGATQIGLSAAGTGQNRDLQFVTGGSTRMTVTSGGDIGVGTSSPTAKFDVVGNGLFRSATTTDGASLKVTNGSTAQCTVGFGAGGNTFPGIWLNQPSPTFSNYAFLGSTTDTFFNAPFNGFIYFRNSNVTHMMVDKSGVHIPGVPFVANPANNRLTVACVATTKIGIVVQGASGQTADLQQWTNVSNTPLAKITNEGDIEITNSTNGIILKSPDGTRYRITVTNGGALSSTDLTPAAPTTSPPTTPPP